MSYSVNRIENDLAGGKLTLTNIMTYEDIKARVSNRGCDEEKIASILSLHEKALDSLDKYKAEQAEQIGLTDRVNSLTGEAYDFYMECSEIARLAFEDMPGIIKLLYLKGKRSKSFKRWTTQGIRFFKDILARQDLLQDLLKYNLTKEDLEKGLGLIEELLAVKYSQEEQKGTVQSTYKVRDKDYKAFRKPMRQLRKLLRIEYKKESQQLERLGIRAYSDGYVKAATRRKNEEREAQKTTAPIPGSQSEPEPEPQFAVLSPAEAGTSVPN